MIPRTIRRAMNRTMMFLSVQRSGASAQQSIKQTEQMNKLMDQLPKNV